MGRGSLKGYLGRATVFAVLVGGGYWAWRWGPEVVPRVEAWLRAEAAEDPVVSPELAHATLDRFKALRDGSGPARVAVSNVELVSVLKYALTGTIPELISELSVTLADGGLTLSGRVAVDALGGLSELGAAVAFLPDTLLLELEGSLVPFDDGRAALVIHRVIAAHIPLPNQMIAGVLEALGRETEEGLPVDALAVPLPSGLESVYILRDSLVLVADR